MKRWAIEAVALLIAGLPAAYAASPSQERPKSAQAQQAKDTAAKQCKAERIGVQALTKKYGTNQVVSHGFGRSGIPSLS